MNFEVKTEDGTTVKLDRFQLLEILLGEVLEQKKEEFVVLGSGMSQYLHQRGTYGQLTSDQLVTTSIALGYFFKVFMDKNSVTITAGEDQNELVNENPT